MNRKTKALVQMVIMISLIVYMWVGIIIPAKPWEGFGWIGKAFAGWILFGTFYASWHYVFKPQRLEISKAKEPQGR